MRSQVADPGLARRPTTVWTQITNGVIHIDLPGDCCGVGEHVSGVPELQVLPKPSRDLIAVHWGMTSRQIDHRFQVDHAAVPEHTAQPTQQHRTDIFDADHTGPVSERLGTEVDIHHSTGPGPVRIERRRLESQ